jgi:succinate-semialdehyde dehydrogenase / glutarate-semialdehyde dehydrogenase
MGTATATRHYATVNPYTGETVKEFDTLTRDEVDRAVAGAHDAFLAWRERPIAERAAIVRRAGELMLERAGALARLVTLEMGKLIAESREEADLSARILRYYGDEGPGIAAPRPLARARELEATGCLHMAIQASLGAMFSTALAVLP